MQIDLRNANIGIGVMVVSLALGWLVVGGDPSDTQAHVIFACAYVIGFAALIALDMRDERRERDRPHR